MGFNRVLVKDVGDKLVCGEVYQCIHGDCIFRATFYNNQYEFWFEAGGKVVPVTWYADKDLYYCQKHQNSEPRD